MAVAGQILYFTANNRIFRSRLDDVGEPVPIATLYSGNRFGDNFHYFGITCSPDGIVYLADASNHTICSLDGNGRVSTIAGCTGEPGFADADIGSEARFAVPIGLCYYKDDTLIVADSANNAIRAVSTTTGATHTLIGNEQESIWHRIHHDIEYELPPSQNDGPIGGASLRHPCHVAADSQCRIIVASNATGIDGSLGNTVRMIDVAEGTVRTIAGQSVAPNVYAPVGGSADISRLTEIQGMAIGWNDNIYVGNDQYLLQISHDGMTSIIYTNTISGCQYDYGQLDHENKDTSKDISINPIRGLCWDKKNNALLIFGEYTIVRLVFDEEGEYTIDDVRQ